MVVRLRDMFHHFLSISMSFSVFRLRTITLVILSQAFVRQRIVRYRICNDPLLQGPCQAVIVCYPTHRLIVQVRSTHVVVQRIFGKDCRVLPYRRNDLHLLDRQRIVRQFLHVVDRRILLTSTRFVAWVLQRRTLNVRRVAVLRVVQLLINLAIRMGGPIPSFRYLTQRARAALRMVLSPICEANGRLAVRLQVFIGVLTSCHMVVVVRVPLLLRVRTNRIGELQGLLTSNVTRTVSVFYQVTNDRHVPYQRIRRRSIVRLRLSRSNRPFMIPLQPFRMQLTIRRQRHVLHRQRIRQYLQGANAVARLTCGRVIARR